MGRYVPKLLGRVPCLPALLMLRTCLDYLALFSAIVSGTIFVLCILAMRQDATEKPEGKSKKSPQEHLNGRR